MAVPANGYVPPSALVEVEPGMFLESATAAAYQRAKADSGGILRIPRPAGAYRDYKTQADMKAGRPSYSYWNIDPAMAVSLASAGNSSHGRADRVDIVTGAARTWAIANLGRYGFTREFGSADPGHFRFMHPTWAPAVTVDWPKDDVRLVARFLNSLGIKKNGVPLPTTGAAEDGIPYNADPGAHSRFYDLLQGWGRGTGDYPEPFLWDGIPGPRTIALFPKALAAAKQWAKPKPKPNERVVAGGGVKRRAAATSSSTDLGSFDPGAVVAVERWAVGQPVTVGTVTSNIWFGVGNTWSAAAAFLSQSTDGIPQHVPTSPEPPKPVGTFGIDIATTQRDLDIAAAKADGVQFVIVKMGGLNVTPQYVSPHYAAQVDKVRAAKLPLGHYYVPGKNESISQQAQFFVENLYGFDAERDVLMLDNETLDSNGVTWRQEDAVTFFKMVNALTGIPYERMWHYMGANDYRTLGPWDELEDLGVKIVWAAYGANTGSRTPDHEPDLRGSVSRYDVHQFGSKLTVGGFTPVDGMFSPLTVEELFPVGGVDEPTIPSPGPLDPPVWPEEPKQPSTSKGTLIAILGAIGAAITALIAWVVSNLPG